MRLLSLTLTLICLNACTKVAPEKFTGEVTPEIFSRWKLAAEKGSDRMQWNLAVCYSNGRGVSKDPVEAVKWFRKAAEQGNAPAQYFLGQSYFYGEGVPIDKVEAVKWFRKSAEQGVAGAQCNLGFCYYKGIGGMPEDLIEAVKWYRKAAEQGNDLALSKLGICYEKGRGVAPDMVEAYAYYNVAGITDKDVLAFRDVLAEQMTPAQIEAGIKRSKDLQNQVEVNVAKK